MAQGIFTLKQVNQAIRQTAWPSSVLSNGYSVNLKASIDSGLGLTGPSSFNATGDFTIEGFVNENSVTQNFSGQPRYFNFGASNFAVVSQVDGAIRTDINGQTFTSSSSILSLGAWRHWAVTRSGTSVKLFYNGVNVASGTVSGTVTMAGACFIGCYGFGGNSNVSGNMSNFRLVVGTALYTTTFTPPTSPLTAISGTQLLTCQNQVIIDNSSNAIAINGGSRSDTVNPFTSTVKPSSVQYLVVAGGGGGATQHGGGGGAGGLLQGILPITIGTPLTVTVGGGGTGSAGTSSQAGLVGGSGQNSVFSSITSSGGGGGAPYRYTSDIQGVAGGSGGGGCATDFSATSVGGQRIFGQGNNGGNGRPGTGSNYLAGGGGGAGTQGESPIGSSNVAGFGGAGIASAISGTVTTYAGGGGGGTPNSGGIGGTGGVGGGGTGGSATVVGTAGTTNTGGGGGGASGQGITAYNGGSGIVIISYPDIYNIPTALTYGYQQGELAFSSTSGSGSLVGAGGLGGNMIVYPNSNNSSFAFGTSNFTIELWFYTTSFSSSPVLYDSRPSATQGAYPCIYVDVSGVIYWYVNTSAPIVGSTLSLNTWYHVAVARSGSSTKMFINGTQVGSTYTDTNTYLNSYPFLASSSFSVGNNYLAGAMTNVRVNNTTAVYTSNFTAPTAPLTNISGTVLLLTCNSNAYLTDSSSNQCLMRSAGPAEWSSISPFPTGMGYKNRVYSWKASGTVTF